MQLFQQTKARLAARAILVAAAIGLSSVALAVDNRGQWYVTNTDTFLTNTAYELWTGDVQLGYARYDYGEDVTWERAKGGHFIFIPDIRDHRHLPAQNFDKVAIYNTKGKKYLVKNQSLPRGRRSQPINGTSALWNPARTVSTSQSTTPK